MLPQKSTTVMAPQRQQQWHPAGVLHGVLLLLCLALLMHASVSSAYARPVPSDNDNGDMPEVVRQQGGEGDLRPQEVFHVEKAEPHYEANVKNLVDCGFLSDSENNEPCEDGLDRRMLGGDYGEGSPDPNQDSHPGGPYP